MERGNNENMIRRDIESAETLFWKYLHIGGMKRETISNEYLQ